jgi:hypothetical protein
MTSHTRYEAHPIGFNWIRTLLVHESSSHAEKPFQLEAGYLALQNNTLARKETWRINALARKETWRINFARSWKHGGSMPLLGGNNPS